MRYRAKDIAEELGVSPATVSLVINGKPGVGEKLRNEILNKIEERDCGYLLKKEPEGKGNIGFITCKCEGPVIEEFPFFGYILESVNKTVQRYNYRLSMIHLDNNMKYEERLQIIKNSGCEGYIVYAVEMSEKDLPIFEGLKEPCVFVDNAFHMNQVDSITIDNYLGVAQAMEYLYKMGHRKIGYIQSKVKISSFEDRFDAFKQLLAKYNMYLDDRHIMKVGYLEAETKRDVINYLHGIEDLPTAFFADNDLLACRAIYGMKEAGYNVPKDISIVGFDDRPICSFTEPRVTTIAIPRDEMGACAVETLISRIENKRSFYLKSLVGTVLIERESVYKIKK